MYIRMCVWAETYICKVYLISSTRRYIREPGPLTQIPEYVCEIPLLIVTNMRLLSVDHKIQQQLDRQKFEAWAKGSCCHVLAAVDETYGLERIQRNVWRKWILIWRTYDAVALLSLQIEPHDQCHGRRAAGWGTLKWRDVQESRWSTNLTPLDSKMT